MTYQSLVRFVVGPLPTEYSTGAERISTLWDALKWRLASLPGLDASVTVVGRKGRVHLFRTGADRIRSACNWHHTGGPCGGLGCYKE